MTGLFTFTLLMQMLGLTSVMMSLALISNLHDWSGIALGLLVMVHLALNGR